MAESTYEGRTFKLGVLLLMLLVVAVTPGVLLAAFREEMTPTRFYWGAGATVVALLLVIAGGQSAATFTANVDGFSVSTRNYLLPIRRTRRLEWSDVFRVEQVGLPDHINPAGSNVGGHYLVVHLLDGSTIRVVAHGGDPEGYELAAFRKAIEQGIATAQG